MRLSFVNAKSVGTRSLHDLSQFSLGPALTCCLVHLECVLIEYLTQRVRGQG